MFVPLVLAAALIPPAPPGPLSPADLPPPPAAKPVEYTTPPPGIDLAIQCREVAGPAEDLPARAVAAVAALPGFRFAEVGPDGVVRGYTGTVRLAVVVPERAGAAYVVAVGRGSDGKPADRAAEAVTGRLGKPVTGPKPPTRAGAPDPAIDDTLPPLAVRHEARPPPADRHRLRLLAKLTLTQLGCEQASAGPLGGAIMAGGTKKDGSIVSFLIDPTRSATTTHYLSVVGGAKYWKESAARTAGELLLKVLYD